MSLPEGPKEPMSCQMLQWITTPISFMRRCHKRYGDQFTVKLASRVELLGSSLDPGTVMAGCIYLAHHREEVYPDPDVFRPERFLERRYSPYEYLPFGGGARRCIGMAFAQFEMKIVLGTVLLGVELAQHGRRAVRLVRRGLTSGPSPFRMVVQERCGMRHAASRQASVLSS
jgi:cytochrome P450 family 110